MDKIELPQEFPPGLAFKLGMSFVAHPMEVAKVLIQVKGSNEAIQLKKSIERGPALRMADLVADSVDDEMVD